MGQVFLSYSHKDREFVEKLYQRLKEDGVDCFFDKTSIAWGTDFVTELEKGIDNCEKLVLILTPDYCKSEWARIERTSAMADLSKKLLPLLLNPCDNILPRFLKSLQFIDISSESKFESEYPRICQELGGTITEKVTPTRGKLPPVSRLPKQHWIPYRSLGQGFVGRVEALWEMDDILRAHKTGVIEGVGVIMGTGGLGKTQLAIEYAHRFGTNYPGGVFWIDTEQGIMAMISRLVQAAQIEIDHTLQEKEQLAEVWRQFSGLPPVLIILDNFLEEQPLQPWLPPDHNIFVLVTTRRRDLNFARISLNFMTIAEGIELLNTGARKFGPEAEKLVEVLGGLPLALELVKNFLNRRPELTVEQLIREIEKTGEMKALKVFADKYADELPSGHCKEVAATIQIGWNQCSKTAKTILQTMSLLGPSPIPRRLLRRIIKPVFPNLFESLLDETISELANKFSLVELDEEYDPVMHRLIAGFVKSVMRNEKPIAKKVITAVSAEMNRVYDEHDTLAYHELEKVWPHAEMLLSPLFSDCITTEEASDLSDCLLRHNRSQGRYRIAEKYGRKALESAQKSYESGHPSIATSQSNLGLVLNDLGELEEARDLLHLALESDEKSYAPGHPSIAIRQSNLALALRDLRKLEEARDLLRLALESNEKSYAPGHPYIARGQSNLAMVLQELGELEEAQALLRLALESNEKSYAPGHPYIARSQSNLAQVLQDLGELEEARDLLRLALESDEKSYAPDHPSIAIRQSNLALALKDLGELEEARELAKQAYETFLRKFGPEHPKTRIAKGNWEAMMR